MATVAPLPDQWSPSAGRAGGAATVNSISAARVLAALDIPVIMLDSQLAIMFVNPAAETFLGRPENQLTGCPLSRVLPNPENWLPTVELARDGGTKRSEHGIRLSMPGASAPCVVEIAAAPADTGSRQLVVSIRETTVSHRVDRRMGLLGAAQTITGMAAVLAHEIKNPLSGIRGASQLLENGIADDDKPLTELIRTEVDRICGLIDRMTVLSSHDGIVMTAVNIHRVLDRVQQLAEAGFGQHVRFETDYDPSLPDVEGDHDLLIQALLNLVKNAAEACPPQRGVIRLSTAYRSGVGLVGRSDNIRRRLGVEVTVSDNGSGIDHAIRDSLFELFVSAKSSGSGLGLALTAKIVNDLGGMIDCDGVAGTDGQSGSVFRVLLPVHTPDRERR